MTGQLDLVDTSALARAGRGVSATAAERVAASMAPNTLRAYRRIWDGRPRPDAAPPDPPGGFVGWCAEQGVPSLPADEHTFGEWVSSLCDRGLAPTTVQQSMAAVRTAHTMAGHEGQPPTRYADRVLKGYRRSRAKEGAAPVREAPPITAKALRAMVDTCDVTTLIGCRDHLILVIGFGLMARRSELADLLLQDIVETDEGLDVLVRQSKTDQDATGAEVAVPRGAWPGTDPVASLARWREALASRGITTGPVFRSVTKGGVVGGSLSTKSINRMVRQRAVIAQVPNAAAFTAHSLRAGGLTAALEAGRAVGVAARHGRWSPTSPVVHKYARRADRWEDNAMRGVL
jgi:integrase